MKSTILQKVHRHGYAILRAFPNAVEKNPVKLCRKLRRIEAEVSRVSLAYCNGESGVNQEDLDRACKAAFQKLMALLGGSFDEMSEKGVFINCDPRGHALKIESEWANAWNEANNAPERIPQDWGHYGLLAPDLK